MNNYVIALYMLTLSLRWSRKLEVQSVKFPERTRHSRVVYPNGTDNGPKLHARMDLSRVENAEVAPSPGNKFYFIG